MTTPEQDTLLTVVDILDIIAEEEDDDETLSVESAETERDWDDIEEELYQQWLDSAGCEYCSGCQYCNESSPFEGGTDT